MTARQLLILFLFSSSCASKTGLPENVMPVNTMKEVMWDMIQVDEYAAGFMIKDSTKNLKEETLKLYGKVFAIHKISPTEFGNSYDYYQKHPAIQKVLMDSLQLYSNKMREKSFQKNVLILPILPDTAAIK